MLGLWYGALVLILQHMAMRVGESLILSGPESTKHSKTLGILLYFSFCYSVQDIHMYACTRIKNPYRRLFMSETLSR